MIRGCCWAVDATVKGPFVFLVQIEMHMTDRPGANAGSNSMYGIFTALAGYPNSL